MLRAVVYARVSSKIQRDKHTIASQLRLLPEYVSRQGWQLAKPADTYVDDGKSAKTGQGEKREGFRRLLADMARGIFDVVVVIDEDRLTRSEDLGEVGDILGAFQRSGIKIATVTGGLVDLSLFSGRIIAVLKSLIGGEDNSKRILRGVEGRIQAAMAGKLPSGVPPWGLTWDRRTKAWGLDPEAHKLVSEIFTRVASGQSMYSIANDLDAQGIPRMRSKGTWSNRPGAIADLIKNTAYMGELVGRGKQGIIIKVPPMVSPEVWHQANEQVKSRFRGRTENRPGLVSGIARCGECGLPIWVKIGGNNTGRRYYVCKSTHTHTNAPHCGNRMYNLAKVDAELWAKVQELVTRPAALEGIIKARREAGSEDGSHWASDLESYTKQLAALDQADAAILALFRRGKIAPAAMETELDASARQRAMLERNRQLAQTQLATQQRAQADVTGLLESLDHLRATVACATQEDRMAIIRKLIPGRDGLEVVFYRDRIEAVCMLQHPTSGEVVTTIRLAA